MPGKFYAGSLDTPKDPQLAREYCEGRSAAAATWPTLPTNSSTMSAVFQLGVASYIGGPNGVLGPRDSCDLPPSAVA